MSEADEYFGINEYSDLIVLTKPVVYMTVQEICDTHRILVEYLDRIAPDESDALREIFRLLHYEPNLDSLTENLCSRVAAAASTAGSLNNSSHSATAAAAAAAASHDTLTKSNVSKNTQLCLTLTNRFTPSGDEKTDLNNLFIRYETFLFYEFCYLYIYLNVLFFCFRTKRFIVEIMHCQPGETLLQILKSPATLEQVREQQMHFIKILTKVNKNRNVLCYLEQKKSKQVGLFRYDLDWHLFLPIAII